MYYCVQFHWVAVLEKVFRPVLSSMIRCTGDCGNRPTKQQDLGLSLCAWRTRKAVFWDDMGRVVPWAERLALFVHAIVRDATAGFQGGCPSATSLRAGRVLFSPRE